MSNVIKFPSNNNGFKADNKQPHSNIKGGYFFIKLDVEKRDDGNDVIYPPEIKVRTEDSTVMGALIIYLLSIADELEIGSSLVDIANLYNSMSGDNNE